MPASISWWGWLLIAVLCWYVQLMMSLWTEKGGVGAWTIRALFLAGMVLSLLLGVFRFGKWALRG
jgi:hypothetical protein